jgi:hypothetical protein
MEAGIQSGVSVNNARSVSLCALLIGLLLLLAACGPTATQLQPQPTVTIDPSFQSQVSPVPSPSQYRCGAWASNNAPSPNATIVIFARLIKNVKGISGATASAIVHFKDGDQTLDQQPTSDDGGYVSFKLPLQGRQPDRVPATVDVIFSNFPGGTVQCTPAFFTPM